MPVPNPTQTAYDRIQQSGCRSPITVGGVIVYYELRKEGIKVSAYSRSTEHSHHRIVGWSELGLSQVDPLLEAQKLVLKRVLDHDAAADNVA